MSVRTLYDLESGKILSVETRQKRAMDKLLSKLPEGVGYLEGRPENISLYKVDLDTLTFVEDNQAKDKKAWKELRRERNVRLKTSDWSQLDDVSVDKVEWAKYRKSLRDLPATVSDPTKVVWPKEPS